MSVGNNPYYLNPEHPNFERWQRSREHSFERGKFVYELIKSEKNIENAKILDIGSGFGGTLANFEKHNSLLFSFEYDLFKLKHHLSKKAFRVRGDIKLLPFANERFDVIILQDVIEHIDEPEKFINQIKNLLKKDGIIFLSTPNKYSLVNIISDPHWGFPLIALFSRKFIKKFFIPLFRPLEKYRFGIAQLLSLNQLMKIFKKNNLEFKLHTTDSVRTLFTYPDQIIWSKFHLLILKAIQKLKLNKLILSISNDKPNLLNKFITPTFYFTLMNKN